MRQIYGSSDSYTAHMLALLRRHNNDTKGRSSCINLPIILNILKEKKMHDIYIWQGILMFLKYSEKLMELFSS